MELKKIVFSIILIASCIMSVFAHDVDKYKYFCLDVKDNPYGLEKKFLNKFQEYGFYIIDSDFYKSLDAKEKSLVLFADYYYDIVANGYSPLTLRLKTASGTVVWEHTGLGGSLTAKGDMNGASKQIFKAFEKLNYEFNPNLATTPTYDHKFAKWTEDSVKTYLRNKPITSVEGIYKDYSNNGNAYSIAILRDQDTYYGIIVSADNGLWSVGEAKIILRPIEKNVFDAEYYNADHKKWNALATLKNNRFLEIQAPGISDIAFLKYYPSSSESRSSESAVQGDCSATGSGILISDNIIVTNYHVVEDANRIEVILNINGEPESFKAKVLTVDKTNDLAIVCIKDEKYKNIDDAPFAITNKTEDVGTSIFTMGFPMSTILGEEVKITDGIISSKTGFDGDVVTYQISAPIQPGNSGGPLFSKTGNLIGITNAGVKNGVAENVNYAIKTNYVLNLIDSAPINIRLPKGRDLSNKDLPDLIKILKPYVAFIKIY